MDKNFGGSGRGVGNKTTQKRRDSYVCLSFGCLFTYIMRCYNIFIFSPIFLFSSPSPPLFYWLLNTDQFEKYLDTCRRERERERERERLNGIHYKNLKNCKAYHAGTFICYYFFLSLFSVWHFALIVTILHAMEKHIFVHGMESLVMVNE